MVARCGDQVQVVGREHALADAAHPLDRDGTRAPPVELERGAAHELVADEAREDGQLPGADVVHPPAPEEGARQRLLRDEPIPTLTVLAEAGQHLGPQVG